MKQKDVVENIVDFLETIHNFNKEQHDFCSIMPQDYEPILFPYHKANAIMLFILNFRLYRKFLLHKPVN